MVGLGGLETSHIHIPIRVILNIYSSSIRRADTKDAICHPGLYLEGQSRLSSSRAAFHLDINCTTRILNNIILNRDKCGKENFLMEYDKQR